MVFCFTLPELLEAFGRHHQQRLAVIVAQVRKAQGTTIGLTRPPRPRPPRPGPQKMMGKTAGSPTAITPFFGKENDLFTKHPGNYVPFHVFIFWDVSLQESSRRLETYPWKRTYVPSKRNHFKRKYIWTNHWSSRDMLVFPGTYLHKNPSSITSNKHPISSWTLWVIQRHIAPMLHQLTQDIYVARQHAAKHSCHPMLL